MNETGNIHRRIGLFVGPLLAVLVYSIVPHEFAGPEKTMEFTPAGRVTLAVMVWMAVWWLSEAVELSTTALLPITVLPILGALPIADAAKPYAHHLIFLYIGGFTIALAMQRWGLDRRIALATLRQVGAKPANMIGGFMIVTAFLSAFISNTATTAMMLPIALSVVALLKEKVGQGGANFGVALMLGIAYSASIGGLSTLVGTPPNAVLAGFLEETYGMKIGFARWLMFGLPVTCCMLPITWYVLAKWLYPTPMTEIDGGRELIAKEYRALGPMSWGERVTLFVFAGTGFAWIAVPLISRYLADVAWAKGLVGSLSGVTDSGVAMLAAMLLFVIPSRTGEGGGVMNWPTAMKMPWDILILFGGGMSLAVAVKTTGVADFLGAQAGYLKGAPMLVLLLLVVTAVIFLTELTSNMATTATLLPMFAALAPGLGVHPYLLIFPATVAASCAFMMPVATPPNAIVFGSRLLTIPQMVKAGIWMNVAGILVITILAWFLLEPVTGVEFNP